MDARFIQIHYLTSFPASLLNRDDAGFAKRIPFGGAIRTRISSQCLKRHWRTYDGVHGLGELDVPGSVRSRLTFEHYVVKPLVAEGLKDDIVRKATEAIVAEVLGESAKAKEGKKAQSEEKESDGEATAGVKTGQVTVLGRPEIDFIRDQVKAVALEATKVTEVAAVLKRRFDRAARENLRALRHGAGLDAALFGRMVTSDILARKDAAIHVAHAFTVHEEAAESDYFSAMDDLQAAEGGELGSGHINSSELTSGLYYGYVVVDLPLLISNIEGCSQAEAPKASKDLAARVVESLVHLVATVSPGAKKGSTAPYAHAHLVLVEAGTSQPRTLANAFLKPTTERPDLIATAYAQLAKHLGEYNTMYEPGNETRIAGLGPIEVVEKAAGGKREVALKSVAAWAASQVRGR